MRILAVGAHPDDIELGCGATLALARSMGSDVTMLVLSRGEQGGDPVARVAETRQAAHHLGVRDVEVCDLRDTAIPRGVESIHLIEAAIRRSRPDFLLSHSPNDRHQDHQAAAQACVSAGRKVPNVIFYESPSSTLDFRPQMFVDVGTHIQEKLRAVQSFASQASKDYAAPETISGQARFRGNQAGCDYAEAFEVYKMRVSQGLWGL